MTVGQSAPLWFVLGVLARALFDQWLTNHWEAAEKKRARGER